MLLGAIADDFTGATDLALALAKEGMRTVQVIGVPEAGAALPEADAVVISLKSRTSAPELAVAQSVEAGRRLLEAGARQLIFKYCSTFDSTDRGNIGPVGAALLELVGDGIAVVCPAFPTNQRTIYQGHLFVGAQLLSDSPMKDHPLTPMRDANLVRVLQRQTELPVGLVPLATVAAGAGAIAGALAKLAGEGVRFAVVDAVTDDDLRAIGTAVAGARLVTGGSGIAIGLPENFRAGGLLGASGDAAAFAAPEGRAVVIAGSCSAATRRQIGAAQAAGLPDLKLDPMAVAEGRTTVQEVADWVLAQPASAIPLVHSSADPEVLAEVHARLGQEKSGELIEGLFAELAAKLLAAGFRRFLVAGGETSGAVVQALGVTQLEIGPEIDPGVPWTIGHGAAEPVALALKSGNFGTDDFFTKAWGRLE